MTFSALVSEMIGNVMTNLRDNMALRRDISVNQYAPMKACPLLVNIHPLPYSKSFIIKRNTVYLGNIGKPLHMTHSLLHIR